MNDALGVMAGALAGANSAGGNPTFLPLAVAVAVFLGVITPPPAMDWTAEPATVIVAVALYALSVVSARKGRPPALKRIEQFLGVPMSAIAIAVVGLSAADRAGLTSGSLTSASASAADLVQTRDYATSDTWLLGALAAVAIPIAVTSKLLREVSRRFLGSRIKLLHDLVTVGGLGAAAIVSRLPGIVQIALALAAVAAVSVLGMSMIRRWRALVVGLQSPRLSPKLRTVAMVELLLPGAGWALVGRPWLAGPRLIGSGALVVMALVLGIVIVPVQVWRGLGAANALIDFIAAHPPAGGSGGSGVGGSGNVGVRRPAVALARPTVPPAEGDDW